MLYDIVNSKETTTTPEAPKKGLSRTAARIIIFVILGTSLAVLAWPVFLACVICAGIGLLWTAYRWLSGIPPKGFIAPPMDLDPKLDKAWRKCQTGEYDEDLIAQIAENHPAFQRFLPEGKKIKEKDETWKTGRTYTPPGGKSPCPFNR